MPCCLLRIDGEVFDPDAFLATSDVVADTVYRRGESRRGSLTHTTSGFTTRVSDPEKRDHTQQAQAALEYLTAHHNTLASLREYKGIALLLDFGCELPVDAVAGRFYRLPLSLLELCAKLGIEIELSVYATRSE
jgi:hypothetical protein